MQLRSTLSAVTLALALATTATASAHAEPPLPNGASGRVHYDHYRDRGDRDRHRHWGHHRRYDEDHRRHSRRWDRDYDDRSSVIIRDRTGGTYTGNVSGYRDRGNGNYFYVERDGNYGAPREPRRHNRAGPKVIQPGTGSACSNEGGVCVIRPGS